MSFIVSRLFAAMLPNASIPTHIPQKTRLGPLTAQGTPRRQVTSNNGTNESSNDAPAVAHSSRIGRFNSLCEIVHVPNHGILSSPSYTQILRLELEPGAVFHIRDGNSRLDDRLMIAISRAAQGFNCLALRSNPDHDVNIKKYWQVGSQEELPADVAHRGLQCLYVKVTLEDEQGRQQAKLQSNLVVNIEAVFNIDFEVPVVKIAQAESASFEVFTTAVATLFHQNVAPIQEIQPPIPAPLQHVEIPRRSTEKPRGWVRTSKPK